MFTKYGYTTIGIVGVIAFLLISLSFFVQNNPLKIVIILIAAAILFLTLNFFRDPERKTPSAINIVVAPADGKIIVIKQNIFNHFVGENCNQVSIFMSPLNVHVNRIPIDGKVEHLKYYEGKFVAAFDDKASENNERMETGIVNSEGKILFTQVAGFLARRIVNELKIGDEVKTGERFGMIKFGSRVDIFVPSKYIPAVNLNENVYAGETILFEIKTK
ncbi:MAG: phosphatidylserine decarboxylase family protein [Ignavibacteriota bacterium]|nr:MAG: phosphatidylserine decarboxylase family protein [Chlorobiota bacterium]MBE7478296.1 phosphatidylserine decarboxylase family protein [Ignavibacteriales bacterium]MBL1121473.1 phosphatidylserine decarboxylase family protein [Ignavibacteriota bacterium]MCE7857022.1 phosphatidylserine decarboxylase family protein [Ignavibacteria bacterium CHB3]MCL4279249.1 phosphatidylserine decarboxylase family protein [Ignavibacteriaceae bacterium]MEB2295371.1 phosphatidylserine decarboxylase family prot